MVKGLVLTMWGLGFRVSRFRVHVCFVLVVWMFLVIVIIGVGGLPYQHNDQEPMNVLNRSRYSKPRLSTKAGRQTLPIGP